MSCKLEPVRFCKKIELNLAAVDQRIFVVTERALLAFFIYYRSRDNFDHGIFPDCRSRNSTAFDAALAAAKMAFLSALNADSQDVRYWA